MSYSESFKDALTKLGDVVKDMGELNVRTFGGDLTTSITGGEANDWDDLLKNAKTNGTVKLKLSTVIKIDGDVEQFIADDATEKHQIVHSSAVTAGKETRSGIYNFIKDIVD